MQTPIPLSGDPLDICPNCKVDLTGGPIPQQYIDAGHYGNHTHYSRRIGIYDRGRDRTVAWVCPDCNHQWARD